MAKSKFIDLSGLSAFKEKMIKMIPTKVSELTNDNGFFTEAELQNIIKNKVDKSTVQDIPKTAIIAFTSTEYSIPESFESCYLVRNGICYGKIACQCVKSSSTFVVSFNGLPKAEIPIFVFADPLVANEALEDSRINYSIDSAGTLSLRYGTPGKIYCIEFSYPVLG